MAHKDSPSRLKTHGIGKSSVIGSAAKTTLPPGATDEIQARDQRMMISAMMEAFKK
jgi:hypothetical protein